MYYAGIDIGSTTLKLVIINENSEIVGKCIRKTGSNMKTSSEEAMQIALQTAGIRKEQIKKIVATGYGRNIVENKDETIPEIIALGKGLSRTVDLKEVNTILDIGGQDTKVVKVSKNGNIIKFMMNDACAAGTGRFLENIARTLDIPLEEMVDLGFHATGIVDIASTCTVFAESEIITHLSHGERPENVFAGLHKNILKRVIVLVQNVGLIKPLYFTGGVTQNKCFKKMLSEHFGNVIVPNDALLISAIGAAAVAQETSSKETDEEELLCQNSKQIVNL